LIFCLFPFIISIASTKEASYDRSRVVALAKSITTALEGVVVNAIGLVFGFYYPLLDRVEFFLTIVLGLCYFITVFLSAAATLSANYRSA